jgi:hypothetical protein
MLILSVAFVVTAIAGGVDVTRMMTSPVTLARLVGNRAVNVLDRKKRDEGNHHVRGVVGEIAVGVAISYLIDFAPYPWNLLIFLAYYKFVTVIIFIIFPTVMALWIVAKVWYARKNLKHELESTEIIGEKSLLTDDSFSGDEDVLLRRRMTDTATVVQEDNRNAKDIRYNQPRFAHSRAERPIVTHHVIGSYPSV